MGKNGLYLRTIAALIIGVTCFVPLSFAQEIRDEKQEEQAKKITEPLTPLEKETEEKGALKARWSSNMRLSYGYENNPKTAALRKGDFFETGRYSLNFRKTIADRNQIGVAFDLNNQNYHEITDLSSTLFHVRSDYKWALDKEYIAGAGYDFSYSLYSWSEESSYLDHKLFVNFQHRVTKSFYHQLQYEYDWKLFESALANLDATSTFQDNEREDVRESVEYSLGYTFNQRFSSSFRIAGSFNNSNSAFQDYNDYHSVELSPRLSYKITDRLSVNTSYTYQQKDYTSRIVSNGSYELRDRLSTVKAGATFNLNSRHSFSFDYTHRENASNDILSDYVASTYEAGWRFNF